ncbi:MAG: HNH endonuclease signature motif containing protein [bacterium]
MTNNDDFIWSIAKSTDSKRSIQIHFEIWIGSLRKLIGYPTTEPRTFTRAFKKQLWETNNICAYEECGQEVVSIEDAEIDHIEFYWRGGKTIPSNARLVHRYCNRRRGGYGK